MPRLLPRGDEPNRSGGRPRAVVGSLKGNAAVMSETLADRYRREAAECELNAERATNAVDRVAWQRLAEDWTKLARGAEVNPRLNTLAGSARQLTQSNAD
jgi:hypothetical protein